MTTWRRSTLAALALAPLLGACLPSGTVLYSPPNTSACTAEGGVSGNDLAADRDICGQEDATWLGEWNADNGTVVDNILSTANGQTPVFVVYAIPDRDCVSGYSGGGYPSDAAYRHFIDTIAHGDAGRSNAIYIVEPDALPEDTLDSGCRFTRAQIDARAADIAYASQQLSATGASVYLDAGAPGNSGWIDTIVPLLKEAGIAKDSGFATNISAFNGTSAEQSYGDQLSAAINLPGHDHYVIDTSRNGNGDTATTWCNPAGQTLGHTPTTTTGDPLNDAWLWVKYPGQSDGTCNGGPPSGLWWQAYATGLYQGNSP